MAPINRISREDLKRFASNPSLDDYQSIAVQSAVYPAKGTPFGLMYAALGLGGEAGEVLNKVKKIFRDDKAIEFEADGQVKFNEIGAARRQQISKELGGTLWYLASMCEELGIPLSEVASQNLNELCSRGERNMLQGDGDDR